MKKISHNRLLFLLPLLLIFNSCIGLSMDIQMRANGSGRINAEYRISNMAETIGKLDGNENWPIIPTGRADFERTVARINGMRLVSFSSKEGTQEVVYNVTLEFENTAALVKFLDPLGSGTSFNPGRLDIIIKKADQTEMDSSLLELARQVFAGYRFAVSFSAEGNSSLIVTDGAGREIASLPDAQIIQSGRKVSLSIGMAQLISLTDGLGASFRW